MPGIITDLDHVCNALTGFESYINGDYEKSQYARTTLRLNGVNLPDVAGNEGLGTTIKEGGQKMFDMVMAMLKRIKDFFFGAFGGKKAAAIKEAPAEIKKDIEIIKKADIAKMAKDDVQKVINKVKPAGTQIAQVHLKLERFSTLAKEETTDFDQKLVDKLHEAGLDKSLIVTLAKNKLELALSFGGLMADMVMSNSREGLMTKIGQLEAGDGTGAIESVIETLEKIQKVSDRITKARDKTKECLAQSTTATSKVLEFLKSHEKDEELQKAGVHCVTTFGKYNNLYSRVIIMLDNLSFTCLNASKGVKKEITSTDTKSELEKFEEFMNSDEQLKL